MATLTERGADIEWDSIYETPLKTERRIPPVLRKTLNESIIKEASWEIWQLRQKWWIVRGTMFDFNHMTEEQLRTLAKRFGVPVVLPANADLKDLQAEVSSILFKIWYRGTSVGYKSAVYAINYDCELYTAVWFPDDVMLVRDGTIDKHEVMTNVPNQVIHYPSYNDFSGTLKEYKRLDDDPVNTLDRPTWHLDVATPEITTSHFFIEMIAQTLVPMLQLDGTTKLYVVTADLFAALNSSISYLKRLKEVPHIGIQMGFQTDSSGICDSYAQSGYTTKALRIKAVSVPQASVDIIDVTSIATAVFGTGVQPVPTFLKSDVPIPTRLAKQIMRKSITNREKFLYEELWGASFQYTGQSVQWLYIDTLESEGIASVSFTLPYAPLKRGNINLLLRTGNIDISILDDGQGKFETDDVQGNVSYSSGDCTLNFKYDRQQQKYYTVGSVNNAQTQDQTFFQIGLTKKAGSVIVKGSVRLNYEVEVGRENGLPVYLRFIIGDDGTVDADGWGHIVSYSENITVDNRLNLVDTSLTDGKPLTRIVYSDPETGSSFAWIKLNAPSRIGSSISYTYKYSIENYLPEGTEIYGHYYFSDATIEITECGIINSDGEMVAYATFPPVQFASFNNHLSILFLIRRDVYEAEPEFRIPIIQPWESGITAVPTEIFKELPPPIPDNAEDQLLVEGAVELPGELTTHVKYAKGAE